MLGLYLDATIDFFTEQKTRRKTKMNVSFESSKTLAGEGAVLVLLSLIPYVGWVLGIVGVVLLAKAMKEFSNYYQDQSLYREAWTGIKFYIIAIVAAAVAIVGIVLGAASATSMFATNANFVFTAGFAAGLITLLAGLVVAFVFYVLAANHLKDCFNNLAKKSGERSFETAATLLWIGAILTIIGVGLILIFVAWIFATIGFFSMRARPYQQYTPPTNGYYTQPPTNPAPEATQTQTQTA
jgi:uncharacterized membrane protein